MQHIRINLDQVNLDDFQLRFEPGEQIPRLVDTERLRQVYESKYKDTYPNYNTFFYVYSLAIALVYESLSTDQLWEPDSENVHDSSVTMTIAREYKEIQTRVHTLETLESLWHSLACAEIAQRDQGPKFAVIRRVIERIQRDDTSIISLNQSEVGILQTIWSAIKQSEPSERRILTESLWDELHSCHRGMAVVDRETNFVLVEPEDGAESKLAQYPNGELREMFKCPHGRAYSLIGIFNNPFLKRPISVLSIPALRAAAFGKCAQIREELGEEMPEVYTKLNQGVEDTETEQFKARLLEKINTMLEEYRSVMRPAAYQKLYEDILLGLQ